MQWNLDKSSKIVVNQKSSHQAFRRVSQFKSQFRITNFGFASVALLATTTAYCLRPVKVAAASISVVPHQVLASSAKVTDLESRKLQNEQKNSSLEAKYTFVPQKADLFLAQQSDLNTDDAQSSKARLLRFISLSFLLLFFVPLGIFYPLFLFFKMLLVKPNESANIYGTNDILYREDAIKTDDHKSPINLKTKLVPDLEQATVSKLQIAFSAPASQLRHELAMIGSGTNLYPEYDLVKLMHETVAVLIEEECWTHVSYSSQTFPTGEARPEFDLISYKERNKITGNKPNSINYSRNVSNDEGDERNYSYVVVTIILCTYHPAPLFATINTKEQLLQELIKLKKMKQGKVIKFELLWNPQAENLYISNDQLLIEYGDMVRLF